MLGTPLPADSARRRVSLEVLVLPALDSTNPYP